MKQAQDSSFLPSNSSELLSGRCAASLRANGDLMASILADFPPEKLQALDALLAGGGSVGIETLIDGQARNLIRLVGVEREGARLVLATISAENKAWSH